MSLLKRFKTIKYDTNIQKYNLFVCQIQIPRVIKQHRKKPMRIVN